MQSKAHWEEVYRSHSAEEVSWFQERSVFSLRLIQTVCGTKDAFVIDIGGGASTLTGDLIEEGFQNITVLDISSVALSVAQRRLGIIGSARVNWIEADITSVNLLESHYDVWHDRAVFHFLTDAKDRASYVDKVRTSVKPGGHVIVSTFGADGPMNCSGLEVERYSPDKLHSEFGSPFELLEHSQETHLTPFGTEQKFIYCLCLKK